jgi:hypothetical protein
MKTSNLTRYGTVAILNEITRIFEQSTPSSRKISLGSFQPPAEMAPGIILGLNGGRPERNAYNPTAIFVLTSIKFVSV